MKKKLLITTIFMFAVGINSYNAACSNEEINARANEIMFSVNGILADDEIPRDRVSIYLEGISDDLYIIAINNNTNKKETYKEIENGVVSIETPSPNQIYNYTIKVHSSATECENELIRMFNVKTVAYNPYAKGSYCTELIEKGENFSGCEMFTEKKYDDETFNKELEDFLNQKPEKIEKKIKDLFYEYYYFALIPIAVLGLYYAVRLALIKRSKKKNEEL